MKKFFNSRDGASKSAALMIVLALVVMLTGVALAYLSRTTTDRQLAQSSYNDTSADLLARSALDIVVSDFKQEIINNPTVTMANIQPTRYGDASIPNLIRRSYFGDPTNRTSGVSSMSPSVNGRSISTTRWNSHYLVPRGDPTDISINPSPIPAFVAPDWVLVTAQGPNSAPPPSAVIGRYAFAAYDEAGLLDMNVAGYPNWSGNPGGSCNPDPTPWLTNVGRKGTVGLADLTALGAYAPPRAQIDNIVGWRNYATTLRPNIQIFGNFTFPGDSCTTQDSYGSYLLDFGDPPFTFDSTDQPVPISSYPFSSAAANIFPTPAPGVSPRTDQVFISRQQLLKLQRSLGFSQNLLQYMGSSSRERNRPAPDWPYLGNNLSEGRFCFDNLDLLKPNPDGCTQHGRKKGYGKGKGRGHLCGTEADIANLFGLKWIKSGVVGPDPNGNPQPGHWRYIGHNGNWHDPNPNALGHIPCLRGPNKQNDFFQLLLYALFRLQCSSDGEYDPQRLLKTFSIGASIIDQYDSDPDDLDTTLTGTDKKFQSHTTVIE